MSPLFSKPATVYILRSHGIQSNAPHYVLQVALEVEPEDATARPSYIRERVRTQVCGCSVPPEAAQSECGTPCTAVLQSITS